ncbi:MAG: AI-2E family transporter [bacterium]
MLKLISDWYRQHFCDPQVAILSLLLLLGTTIILFAGQLLAPLLAAIIIAYLLDGGVLFLQDKKIPRLLAVIIVFALFILLVLAVLLILLPLLLDQAKQFVGAIPSMIANIQTALFKLPEEYPALITEKTVSDIILSARQQAALLSQELLSLRLLASLVDLLSVMVYSVIVPLLVFFFLKDKEKIIVWFQSYLPKERQLVSRVWLDVNNKIAGYVRGKFIEILITWIITYLAFLWFDLNYALLLSFAVGISVLVPYIGAIVVTIPVAIVAYFQWGYGSEFAYVLITYGIIQFLDGNLLVPLLFSEMVNLHPAAIIVAVLVFGGLWGFWGIFFAIPLATLVNAVLQAWPKVRAETCPPTSNT